jgi:lipopolysaccharide export system permease protein
MSVITRYILGEFLKTFVAALTVLVLILVFTDVVKELVNRGFGLAQIVLIVPYLVPYATKSAIHAALLFSACNVFGRLAANNEMLAAKSLGISPLRLIGPTLALSLPISFLAVWLDEVDATWGSTGPQRILVENVEDVAYGILKRQRIYRRPEFTLVVKDVHERTLICPHLTLHTAEGVTVVGAEGELHGSRRGDRLRIVLHGGTMQGAGFQGSFTDTFEHEVPLTVSRGEAYTWDRCVRQQSTIDRLSQETQTAATPLMAGAMPAPALQAQLQTEQRTLRRLQTQCLHKWANGFCCFFFVLIGAPTAMLLRSGDWLMSFFACFLPIVLVYQPLHKLPIYWAESGMVPPYCVWLGDFLLAGVALAMLRRIVRH